MLTDFQNRILGISYKYKRAHISSALTSVEIIDEIYEEKKPDDIFVLSCGHCFLALCVVLEKRLGINAEELCLKHGTHPKRDVENNIHFSTGSLGCGLPAALGFALADRNRNVYCLISDGESFSGSIYETMKLKEKFRVDNLKVYCNANGVSSLSTFDKLKLSHGLFSLGDINIRWTSTIDWKDNIFNSILGHYYILTDNDAKELGL
jgi:transketolase N-terminal domain/subunit